MKKTVLAVVAHPDDEVLGCGGTLRWHADRGDDVFVCFLADGESSRETETASSALIDKREQTARKAAGILGVKDIFSHRFPDNRMDGVERLDIIQAIESHIEKLRPHTVYTHHVGDVNVDHQLASDAVVTACRSQPGHPVRSMLFFETASSTEWQPPASRAPFAPNWFVDISTTLDAKLAALKAYADEMRPWPHARSIEALTHLARWRGATVGVEAAEAFMLGRKLVAK